MIFTETPLFTESVEKYMTDEEYRLFQNELLANPEKGDLIQETGGLRKIRYKGLGKGKRGGLRVIYYWRIKHDQILMLMVYPKNMQENLSKKQKVMLKHFVEQWDE